MFLLYEHLVREELFIKFTVCALHGRLSMCDGASFPFEIAKKNYHNNKYQSRDK